VRISNGSVSESEGRNSASQASRWHSTGPVRPAASSGYGLTGLRERVEILGGEFRAGPDGDGGFDVTALLPVAPAGTGNEPS
jgi:signal transduction histidine kinase